MTLGAILRHFWIEFCTLGWIKCIRGASLLKKHFFFYFSEFWQATLARFSHRRSHITGTAVFISHHIDPVILTLVIEGGYTFTSCRIFCLPWHRHACTRNLGFTSHSKYEAIEVKRLAQDHKRGGQWRVLNPRCSDQKSDTLTTRPRRSSESSRKYGKKLKETIYF
jgi:hypothetical protein